MTIIHKCSPHHWTTPKPGDTDLICPDCGRDLSLLEICRKPYVCEAIFNSLSKPPNDLNNLDAFRGFWGKGPRVLEFHPEGLERSLSLARAKEKTSNYYEAEAYRTLKELHHKEGYYDGWKDDNATIPPIVWTPEGKVLPLEPSLAIKPLSPFFDWGYDGDAPSQLALAILYDHTKDKQRSLEYYEDFKYDKVAHLPNTVWGLLPPEGWLKYR